MGIAGCCRTIPRVVRSWSDPAPIVSVHCLTAGRATASAPTALGGYRGKTGRACQDGSFIRRSKAFFLKNLLLKALVLVVDPCESWGLLAVAGLSRESSAAGAILRRLWTITV